MGAHGEGLSPMTVHVNIVRAAMKPTWGNLIGLKIRAVGDKGDNLFIMEFTSKADMDRVLLGMPWMVGWHVVVLKTYDEKLSALEIVFYCMEI